MTRWLGKPVLLLFAVGVWLAAAGNGKASPATENALVIEAVKARIHTEGRAVGNEYNLFTTGDVGDFLQFAQGGQYEVVVRARGSVAGGEWPVAAIKLDGDVVRTFRVARPDFGDFRETIEAGPGLHTLAVAFTNDVVIGGEDRNLYLERIAMRGLAGQAAPRLGDPAQWTSAGETREQEALARAAESAEAIRKGEAVVEVRDAAGRTVAEASVSVELVRHDFLFGCNIYMFDRFQTDKDNAEYKRRFAGLFNYATTGFYWRWYEAERGKPQYDYTDKVVAWCGERGIRLKGHPLLWGDQAGVPRWSEGQPSAELRQKRVEEIMTRYRGKIEFWEVVNEPSHQPQPKVEECYPWARATDPSATLIINDYHVLADGCPQFFRLLKNAVAQGVPFDGIGIQAHEPRTMRFPLDRCRRILDQYAALGKPLHITEYTPTSAGEPITGSWKQGKWDEAAQAEWAVKFYRLCFGHPAVMAITWWDLCDRGSWLKGGGMLRADLSPKPVYDALRRLIHEEWHTQASGKTDATGAFHFRGYYGLYRVTARDSAGRERQAEFHLAKAGTKSVMLTLDSRSK